MMKKSRALALMTSLMLALGGSTAYAEQSPVSVDVYFVPMHFMFDQVEMTPPDDQHGFIYEGSTYVPLRFVSYGVDKAVRWDGDTYTVTVEQPKDTDKAELNEYKVNQTVKDSHIEKADLSNLESSSIDVYMQKVNYVFDGEVKQPPEDLPGFIYQDSLYVPMRFFSESVGKKIAWDQETYTVSASAADAVQQSDEKPATDGTQTTTGGTSTGTTTSAGGGVYYGGGGGGGVTVSAKADIEQKYEDQATQLENRTVNEFYDLLLQYRNATDESVKASIKSQGLSKLAQVEAEFNSIVANMEAELKASGYTTEKADEMRAKFAQEKASGQALLCSQVSCEDTSANP